MKYQLVLQWPAATQTTDEDYEELLQTEELLVENLVGGNEVDGHDLGPHDMNIFILTDDPRGAFEQATAILRFRHSWAKVRAAFREIGADQYTVLWPQNLTEFTIT